MPPDIVLDPDFDFGLDVGRELDVGVDLDPGPLGTSTPGPLDPIGA